MKKRLISNAKILARKKNKGGAISIFKLFRRVIKLGILLILLLVVIFTLQKYKLIPEKYAVLMNSFGEKVINNVNNSLDIKKPVAQVNSEVEEKPDDLANSNYDFEYKYWSLSYMDEEDPDTPVNENEKENSDDSSIEESTKINTNNDSKTNEKSVNSKYVLPVFGKLVSGFGLRSHPIKKTKEFHEGVDLAANSGTLIKAFYGGTVSSAGFDGSYGYNIRITHDSGLQSLYAHCSKLIVKKGQKVKAGDVIAYVGSTGSANGPHLHFEIIKNKVKVDPVKYLNFN